MKWPVAEVAKLLGKSRQQVYRDIQEGKLCAEKTGPRKTWVAKAALLEYLARWN